MSEPLEKLEYPRTGDLDNLTYALNAAITRINELEAKYEGHVHTIDGKRIGAYKTNTTTPNPKENE